MPSCAVKWCISQSHVHKREAGISFHMFPQDVNRRRKWTHAVRLERQDRKWIPSKNRKICSLHFREEDFYETRKGNLKLRPFAVPICTMVFAKMKPADPIQSTSFQANITSGTVNDGTLVPSVYLAPPSNIHTDFNIKTEEDTIDEHFIKSEPNMDEEADDSVNTDNEEHSNETYLTSNIKSEVPVEDHPPSTITLDMRDPLLKPELQRSARLPNASSSQPTKKRLQSPPSSTQPSKIRLRFDIEDPRTPIFERSNLPNATSSTQPTRTSSTSSTEDDGSEDISQRLLAIEEYRIETDRELTRAMNRQASALEELLGLARTFVNIYERNNRQNSTNEQESMEQCETSNQQDPTNIESVYINVKEELPDQSD